MRHRLRWTGLLLLLFPFTAIAVPALGADFRGGQANPDVTGTIDDDVYVAGQVITVPADISGELIAVGQEVVFSGSTGGSLLGAGRKVSISGSVGGTARVAAQDIDVAGSVDRDLMGAGQSLQIGPSGSVGGDLLAGFREVEVAGTVGGDLKGKIGRLSISGTVEGDVKVEADQILLRPGAVINGDLIYTSEDKVAVPAGVTVGGKIVRKIPVRPADTGDLSRVVLNLVRYAGSTLLLGLFAAWLFPGFLPGVSSGLRSSPWASLGIGLAGLLLIPVVAVGLVILASYARAGGSLPFVLTAGYALLLVLAKVVAAFTLGALIVRIRPEDPRPGFARAFFALLVGALILGLVSLIPVVGAIARGLVILFALGAALMAIFRHRKWPPVDGDFAGRTVKVVPPPVPAKVSATASE